MIRLAFYIRENYGGIEYSYVSTKAKKVSTLRGSTQLADLQGALCVPTYNLALTSQGEENLNHPK